MADDDYVDPTKYTWGDLGTDLTSPKFWQSLWTGQQYVNPRQRQAWEDLPQEEKIQRTGWYLDEQGLPRSQESLNDLQNYANQAHYRNRLASYNRNNALDFMGSLVAPSITDVLKHPQGPTVDKAGNVVDDYGNPLLRAPWGQRALPYDLSALSRSHGGVPLNTQAERNAFFSDAPDPRLPAVLGDAAFFGLGGIEWAMGNAAIHGLPTVTPTIADRGVPALAEKLLRESHGAVMSKPELMSSGAGGTVGYQPDLMASEMGYTRNRDNSWSPPVRTPADMDPVIRNYLTNEINYAESQNPNASYDEQTKAIINRLKQATSSEKEPGSAKDIVGPYPLRDWREEAAARAQRAQFGFLPYTP